MSKATSLAAVLLALLLGGCEKSQPFPEYQPDPTKLTYRFGVPGSALRAEFTRCLGDHGVNLPVERYEDQYHVYFVLSDLALKPIADKCYELRKK